MERPPKSGPTPVNDVDDVPELSDAELAEMRPAREVLPADLYDGLTRGRAGRPTKPNRKIAIKLRIDPDIVEGFRATGEGWQTRINDTLRRALGRLKARG